MPKKLCADSKYNKFDVDRDGTLTDDEIQNANEMLEFNLATALIEACQGFFNAGAL